jgi:predicted 3-demethylubiquinone-9 3-methyltransferase (glyoxalase superfamily)
MNQITPCLWFDTEAEEAANLYVSIFKNSSISYVSRYGGEGARDGGTVMMVAFELDGKSFTALNGGPQFTFNESVSFQISCSGQEEVDHFWDRLSEGGEEGNCGWLKDRFGVSWQVIPSELGELMGNPDPAKSGAATKAMLSMKKIDIAVMRAAADAA